MTIEAALPGGSQHAREDILRDRTAGGAIAAATHLAGHDGPSDRMFSPIARGIDFQIKEKTEESRPLAIKMRDKPPNRHDGGRLIEHGRQPVEQSPAGDRGSLLRDCARALAVPNVEG